MMSTVCSCRSLSLTTMSWNLSVFSTNKEQNSSQLIEKLQANPLLGFNIEKNLPVAVPNTLFGGNDFIIHAPPTPKATTTTTAKVGTPFFFGFVQYLSSLLLSKKHNIL